MSGKAAAGLPPELAIAGPVATVTLRRPQRRNALRDEDLHRLLDSFRQLDADAAVRVLVLRAQTAATQRPVFCAGYDMAGFDPARHDPRLFERVVEAFEALRPVTVCVLSGDAHGGATDLVLAADLRLALAGCALRMPAASIGLHFYPSGLRRYVSRLGLGLAQRAFLTAQPLSAEELQCAGLFDALVADASALDADAASLAWRVASLAPRAAQDLKRSLGEIAAGRFDEERLRRRESDSLRSADFAEGRAAFAEKRPPRFSGT